jgi:hypothetical protein
MKLQVLRSPALAVLILTVSLLLSGVVFTAILTQYPGLIEFKFGDGWRITVDGRSGSTQPTLPGSNK